MKKLGLLPRLILAIVLGVILGSFLPTPFIRIFATFNSVFGNFLGFAIPLIIIGFVAPGIADLGKGAGKLLSLTAFIAYLSTIISGSFAYFVDSLVFPNFIESGLSDNLSNPEEALAQTFINIEIPPVMGVMTALILAFVLGLGMSALKSNNMKNVMKEFQIIVEKLIENILIPLLPIHIFGIFANMAYAGEVFKIMSTFGVVFIIIILLQIIILIFQYTVAGALAKANPFSLLKNMMPAYFTAVGTQSSAASIAVTLPRTIKNGVKQNIAEFVVPLCATIHLSGSTITITSCAMAVMMLNGQAIDFQNFFPFILMLGVTMVAAPGVPGGAVMAALGILQSMLFFDNNMTSLMIALYLAQDSFGTACNVTGDGAISIIVNFLSGNKLEKNIEKVEESKENLNQ